MTDHVLGHGRLGDFDAELEQLAMDSWSSPEWIGAGHAADEIPDLTRHRWSPTPSAALPRPVVLEALSVPADHGLRLHHNECVPPAIPAPG